MKRFNEDTVFSPASGFCGPYSDLYSQKNGRGQLAVTAGAMPRNGRLPLQIGSQEAQEGVARRALFARKIVV